MFPSDGFAESYTKTALLNSTLIKRQRKRITFFLTDRFYDYLKTFRQKKNVGKKKVL